MFWGCIMMNDKTPLIAIQTTLTSPRYVDLVLETRIETGEARLQPFWSDELFSGSKSHRTAVGYNKETN